MDKHILVLLFFLSFSSLTLGWAGGSGNSSDPYQIENCQQLQDINNDLSAHYKLISNINCSDTKNWNIGKGFNPIEKFSGTFNGNKHQISNLTINRSSESSVGLFGYTESTALVANISLVNANIRGYQVWRL